jgi:hypothetical protein
MKKLYVIKPFAFKYETLYKNLMPLLLKNAHIVNPWQLTGD